MAEYGEDTGMQSDPAKTDGYPVCAGDTNWVDAFTEAAMSLGKVGDVSAPFRTDYGIHIVKYISDITEGAVPLADVKDTISADLLSTKQDDLYDTTVSGWVTDANAKVYKDRLN
jgi:parvulin-like peptidyl-prolyl isomerase